MDSEEINRAVELYALASRYPLVANNCWYHNLVGKHIDVAAASLPSEFVQAAQERVESFELWSIAEELVLELRDR